MSAASERLLSAEDQTPVRRVVLPGPAGKVRVEWTLPSPPHPEWVHRLRGAGLALDVRHHRLILTVSASELSGVIGAAEAAMRAASQEPGGGEQERRLDEARALYEADLQRLARGRR